jgi:hypothetical protein
LALTLIVLLIVAGEYASEGIEPAVGTKMSLYASSWIQLSLLMIGVSFLAWTLNAPSSIRRLVTSLLALLVTAVICVILESFAPGFVLLRSPWRGFVPVTLFGPLFALLYFVFNWLYEKIAVVKNCSGTTGDRNAQGQGDAVDMVG